MDGWGELFNAAIGGGIGGVGGGGGIYLLVRLYLNSLTQKNQELSKQNQELAAQIKELKDEDFAGLERKVEEHLKADVDIQKTLAAMSEQSKMQGALLQRVADGQATVSQNVATLTANNTNLDNFIRGVHQSVAELRREFHHGK